MPADGFGVFPSARAEGVTGVLTEINRLCPEGINIASQFLQTNEAVGYVVIDIDATHSDLALAKLAAVQGTIRSRVLF